MDRDSSNLNIEQALNSVADAISRKPKDNPYLFSASLSANISGTGGATIPLNNIVYDTNGDLDIANNRYVVPIDGYYQINFGCISSVTAGIGYHCILQLNGNNFGYSSGHISAYTNSGSWGRCIGGGVYQLSKGDYLTIKFVGQTGNTIYGGTYVTFMQGFLVSS